MDEAVPETIQVSNDKSINSKKESSFVPESKSLTKEEFSECPRDTTFNFQFGINENNWTAQFKIRGEKAQIVAEFDSDVRKQLDEESTSVFKIEQNGKRLVYPPENLSENTAENKSTTSERSGYYIDGLKPRTVDIDKSEISRLEIDNVTELISETDGRSLVFYTGAGISMGGDSPVWGMTQLKENLGLENGGEVFAEHFRNPKDNNPENLLNKVHEFRKQLFDDVSTPAHSAISKIAENKKKTIVFTENIDLKHEAEGSRLKAVHMDSDEESFNKVKLRAPDIKVLVTVGLSKDDRAIIQFLKRENPELKIISFTLSDETIPDYLDENDAVVLGDVQETLPKLAKSLSRKT